MLENLKPPLPKYLKCKVADELEKLSDSDREILQNALSDSKTWGANTLSRELKSLANIELADTTISRHRSEVCACFRSHRA